MLMLLLIAGLLAVAVGILVQVMTSRRTGPPELPRDHVRLRRSFSPSVPPLIATGPATNEVAPLPSLPVSPSPAPGPTLTASTMISSASGLRLLEAPAATRPGGSAPDRQGRLHQSTRGLFELAPEFSAFRTLTDGQRRGLIIVGVVLTIGLALVTQVTLIILATTLTVVYTAVLLFRIKLFRLAIEGTSLNGTVIDIPDEEALAASDLPIYTILVPAYREGSAVIERLIESLERIDYPRHLLDVKLLLEEDDEHTITAAGAVGVGGWIETVLVPAAEPRTKPKACNFGLTTARGELVTVFDAEDRPEPLQLRRAALAFRQAPPDLACLQAELSYFNPDQNIITRWFTVEYTMWFTQFLPGLTHLGAPLPLGGTSCHFRHDVLVGSGAWDAFNVTEDADLGVRLHRLGYRTAVLRSITMEEANSDFVNWVKQRSRWYKGYLQTWLVHMREPRRLRRELGTMGMIRFGLFVGGTPILALLNPIFWSLTFLWFLAKPAFIAAMFPAPLYYLALICWLGGNFLILYATMLTALKIDRFSLFLAAAFVPIYWIMMSLAAVKAVLQLFQDAPFWEKTEHGLDIPQSTSEAESVARAS